MYPEPHLEKLYRSFKYGKKDNGAELASAFSDWLVQLGGSKALRDALDDCASSTEREFRIPFSLAMGLISITDKTPIVFDLYGELLPSSKYGITVSEIISRFASKEVHTDVLQAFRLLKDREHMNLAVGIYNTDLLDVRRHAFAQDDLETFLNTSDDDDDDFHSAFNSYFIMASFPMRPDSRIHKHLVTNENDHAKLLAARLRRYWIEVFSYKQLKTHDFYQYPDHKTPSLIPGNKNRLEIGNFEALDSPLDDPYLVELLAKHPYLAISSLLPNGMVEKNYTKKFHSVLEKILSLGVSAQQIITYGPAMVSSDGPLVDLYDSVHTFAFMNEAGKSLYRPVYKQHLSNFEPHEVASACGFDYEIIAMYDLLRHGAFLKVANPRLREWLLKSDLGL